MAASKKPSHSFAQPAELIRRRVEFAASGAAGTHADQNARKHRAGQTNRIGSRNSRLRAAIRHEYS